MNADISGRSAIHTLRMSFTIAEKYFACPRQERD
jgi:hypothetical protein